MLGAACRRLDACNPVRKDLASVCVIELKVLPVLQGNKDAEQRGEDIGTCNANTTRWLIEQECTPALQGPASACSERFVAMLMGVRSQTDA